MRYLTREEYDLVLTVALRQHGLTTEQAKSLIQARWPMLLWPSGAGEAEGRGLEISKEDCHVFLQELRKTNPEVPEDPEHAFLTPTAFERFLEWAVQTGRAKLTAVGKLINENPQPLEAILQACSTERN